MICGREVRHRAVVHATEAGVVGVLVVAATGDEHLADLALRVLLAGPRAGDLAHAGDLGAPDVARVHEPLPAVVGGLERQTARHGAGEARIGDHGEVHAGGDLGEAGAQLVVDDEVLLHVVRAHRLVVQRLVAVGVGDVGAVGAVREHQHVAALGAGDQLVDAGEDALLRRLLVEQQRDVRRVELEVFLEQARPGLGVVDAPLQVGTAHRVVVDAHAERSLHLVPPNSRPLGPGERRNHQRRHRSGSRGAGTWINTPTSEKSTT